MLQSLSIQEGEPEARATTSQPTFPMQEKPLCPRCNYEPKFRNKASANNPNGNANRPYYICVRCKNDRNRTVSKTDHERGWITWDDDRGVRPGNPDCDCAVASRQERTGRYSTCPGRGFWTCATGSCAYFSFRRDGLTDEEVEDAEAAFDDGF